MSEQDPAQRPRSYGGGDVLAQAELAALGMQPVPGATHSAADECVGVLTVGWVCRLPADVCRSGRLRRACAQEPVGQ